MSSATSTSPSTRRDADSLGAGPSARPIPDSLAAMEETGAPPESQSPAFQPWQFFLLAGMLAATALVVVATGQSPAAIVLLSLTVVAASLVGLGVYRSIAPLVTREAVHAPRLVGGRTRAALEREKTLVLRSIKELEFDYAMKKVAQADFDDMAGRLRARALRLMRQLEADDGYRGEIERELQARLGSIANVNAAKAAPHACQCGTTNDRDARFCKHCGSRLDAPA